MRLLPSLLAVWKEQGGESNQGPPTAHRLHASLLFKGVSSSAGETANSPQDSQGPRGMTTRAKGTPEETHAKVAGFIVLFGPAAASGL